MSAVLEIRDLSKSYGRSWLSPLLGADGVIRAVDGVSFTVARGEAVALLGPNGSGKTTTLRCVAGLLRPDAGSIRVAGFDLARQPRAARRRFSYVPQQACFPPHLTVREVVELHARLRGVGAERVEAALRQAGFAAADEERRTEELSGGMRQRLSLAVAETPPVELMVLDEPTANLDPQGALELRALARRWRDEGRAILFSTHVLTDVMELADRVVVMVAGRAVLEESRGELRERLGRFAVLRVDVGEPGPAHVEAALAAGASRAELNSRAVIVTAPAERRFAILQRLAELGTVHHFETEKPSLERVYVEYVETK
jgi:ABC-type multidrug transport system ATPase subunit